MATAKQTALNTPAALDSNPLAPVSELPQAAQASPAAVDQDGEIARLRNQVAEMELRNQQLEAEKKSMAEHALTLADSTGYARSSAGRSMATTRNKPTFKFKVSVANNPALPALTITAVDESEAIRLYALQATPGKVLETTDCSWRVECLEAQKRVQTWREAKEKRMIERGHATPSMAVVG